MSESGTSILETVRQGLEDIDYLELAGCIALREKGRCSDRRKVVWDHRVVKCTDHMKESARKVLKMFGDNLVDREANFLGPENDRQLWLNFYEALRHIGGGGGGEPQLSALEEARDVNYFVMELISDVGITSIFDENELRGRILGLEGLYEEFINWKSYRNHRAREYERATMARILKLRYERRKRQEGASDLKIQDIKIDRDEPEVKRRLQFVEIDYVKYLRTVLNNFKCIPRHCKYRDADYDRYLRKLTDYLGGFYQRIKPLMARTEFLRVNEERFEELWENRQTSLSHWMPHSHELKKFYAPATDRLFGTEQACAGHMQSKKYKKVLEKMTPEKANQLREDSEKHDKELARLEFWSGLYLQELVPYVEATVQHIRKKQSRTLDEMRLENRPSDDEGDAELIEDMQSNMKGAAAAGKDSDESDDEEEGLASRKIRNPLNLPLGWDGKPIPYWLYKLHGLSQEFTCEICGNQKYWGRQVFERHFQEWRHAFGMRCLKIPNTVHFKDITKIEDALQLYEKVKAEAAQKAFLADQEVEVEDAQGNVMTPKTYEDLRRQGLL